MARIQSVMLTDRGYVNLALFGVAVCLCCTGCQSQSPRSVAQPAQVAPEPVARFVDRTGSSGLLFKQSHGGCGKLYFVEQVAAGACVFDANGDGYQDIYFPQPKPLGDCRSTEPLHHRLYMNDGRGAFKLSPDAFAGVDTPYGIAAASGDYDNDGDVDLYVACYGGNKLFRNKGNGAFEDVTAKAKVEAGGFSTGAVFFDYDRDGLLDLYVLRYCLWSVETDVTCKLPDGRRDVCNPNHYTAAHNTLYRNNGDGTFSDVTAKAQAAPERRRSLGVAAADFDGDGWLDLFVANDLSANYLLHNNRDGTFTDTAMQMSVAFGISGQSQANMGVAVGDFNDSGRLSVLVTTFSNEPYTLYRNDGEYYTDISATSGIGTATRPFLSFGTCFVDSRNTGRLDLFFANGHVSPLAEIDGGGQAFKQRNQLMLNEGNERFIESQGALPADDVRVHRGTCFADFDNDGKMDLLVTAQNDRPTYLHNESVAGNWLLVDLTDKRGCRTPVGVKCTAKVKGKSLFRVLLGGGGYAGDSDHRVHFGLGNATQIDRLEITWLDGTVQALTNVRANQILKLREAG